MKCDIQTKIFALKNICFIRTQMICKNFFASIESKF